MWRCSCLGLKLWFTVYILPLGGSAHLFGMYCIHFPVSVQPQKESDSITIRDKVRDYTRNCNMIYCNHYKAHKCKRLRAFYWTYGSPRLYWMPSKTANQTWHFSSKTKHFYRKSTASAIKLWCHPTNENISDGLPLNIWWSRRQSSLDTRQSRSVSG